MATNLLSQLINKDTIAQLAGGSDASESQVESLLNSALPVLMQNMAGNASTKEGKDSLAKALSQHAAQTNTTNVTTLLKQADTNDGEKILGHILGGSKTDVTSALAKESGISNKDTLSMLATLAPVLLGLMGNEKEKTAKEDDGLDLGDLITVMGGLSGSSKKKSSSPDLGDVLDLAGDLLGDNSSSKKKKSSGIDLLDLAGDLLADDSSSKKKKKNSSSTAEVMGDLLGKLLK